MLGIFWIDLLLHKPGIENISGFKLHPIPNQVAIFLEYLHSEIQIQNQYRREKSNDEIYDYYIHLIDRLFSKAVQNCKISIDSTNFGFDS